MNSIFIKSNVPSSKNSKINGRFFSKTVQRYLRSKGIKSFSARRKVVEGYKTIPMTFPAGELKEMFKDVKYPIEIGFRFVRGTRHKCDFHNMTQILFDLFTAFDIIPDDDMDHVVARCMIEKGTFYDYNKEDPGVFIKLIKE